MAERAPRSASRTLMAVSGAIVLAAALFAPALVTGECVDAVEPTGSYYQSQLRSLLAIPTNVAVWLCATAAFVAIAWWRSGPRRRRR